MSSYVNAGQLSSQFNFELYNVASAVFLDEKRSFKELANEMDKTLEVYGALHYMGNIMDSHDKNRYMAYANGDLTSSSGDAAEIGWNNPPKVDDSYNYKKAEIYYAYMMSIPGLPVIYYGSEFGMTGAADPDNRRMMRFSNELSDDEKDLLKKVEAIVKLRNKHGALRHGDFLTLLSTENTFAYLRSDFNERILVVINKKNLSENPQIKFPELYNTGVAISLKTGKEIKIDNHKLTLTIADTDWDMFLLK